MAGQQIEHKRLAKPFAVAAVGDLLGKITGNGAVFDEVHGTSSYSLPMDWNDTIRPGAFSRTLADHRKRGIMPAMLLQHDTMSLPIGVWTRAEESGDGLALEGQLAVATPRGAEVYELMKMGAMTGLSIGFSVVKARTDDKQKLREIVEIDLHEVSPVTFPGIDSARITDVKGADPALLKRKIEAALRDVGLSAKEAKAFIADGFEALAQRDVAAGGDDEVSAALRSLAAFIHPT